MTDLKKPCYIFLDFDGTVTLDRHILRSDATFKPELALPEAHIRALHAVRKLGHKIILCTGRARGSVLPVKEAMDIPWDGMIYGAADLWYQNKRIDITYVSEAECMNWLDYCQKAGKIFCYNGTEAISKYDFREPLDDATVKGIYDEVKCLLKENPLTNILVMPAVEEQEIPPTDLSVIHMRTYSDVFSSGCNKGRAILKFCDMVGIPLEQTIGFGDSENDVQMFDICAMNVSMKLGPDALKQRASYVATGDYGVEEGLLWLFGEELEQALKF